MTCDCRKGRPDPECERPGHSALSLGLSTRTAPRRPWWWLLAAPFYVAAGVWEFLTGRWWKS